MVLAPLKMHNIPSQEIFMDGKDFVLEKMYYRPNTVMTLAVMIFTVNNPHLYNTANNSEDGNGNIQEVTITSKTEIFSPATHLRLCSENWQLNQENFTK